MLIVATVAAAYNLLVLSTHVTKDYSSRETFLQQY